MPTSRDRSAGNTTPADTKAFGHVESFGKSESLGHIESFGGAESLGSTEQQPRSPDGASTDGLTIECDCCALRNTGACDDCVVSFLLDREPDDAVVIDADEARAMRMLERAGLVPTLRFSSRAG